MKLLEEISYENEAVSPSKFPAALPPQLPNTLPILISAAWLLFPVLPADPKLRPPERRRSPHMWLLTEGKNQDQEMEGKKCIVIFQGDEFFSQLIYRGK